MSRALVLVAALAATAFAQAPQRSPPTLEQIAAARAEADRIIADAHAEDLFANASTGAAPRVRHLRSGMICAFEPGAGHNDAITIYPSGMPRGDDIGCGHNVADIAVTTFATRYAAKVDAEYVLRGSVTAMRQTFQDLKPYTGNTVSLRPDPDEPAPKPKSMGVVRLTGTVNGAQVFTRAAAAQCGPWIVAQRVTSSVEHALAAEIAAETAFRRAVAGACGAAVANS